MRKCANCYGYKKEDEFPKRTGGGYQSYCIECKRLLDRQYRRAKREEERSQTVVTDSASEDITKEQ